MRHLQAICMTSGVFLITDKGFAVPYSRIARPAIAYAAAFEAATECGCFFHQIRHDRRMSLAAALVRSWSVLCWQWHSNRWLISATDTGGLYQYLLFVERINT